MRFNFLVALVLSSTVLSALSSCTNVTSDLSESHIIGQKLSGVSSLTTEQGSDQQIVVMYDETVKRIHQFDVMNAKFIRSLIPKVPGGQHFELYGQNGNYVIDLTAHHISIFNKDGVMNDQPIQLPGNPVSAAFHPLLGLLVIYDDLQSVGMIQLDPSGNVSRSWVAGSLVKDDATISAGDINDKGQLLLALSSGEIAIVDMIQSMTQGTWVYTSFAPNLGSAISWLAPMHDHPNQILALAGRQIALIDTASQTILGTYTIDHHHEFLKSSKIYDGHLLVVDLTSVSVWTTLESQAGPELTLVYAEDSKIHTRTAYYQTTNLLSSRLNLATDTWSIVDSQKGDYELDGTINSTKQGRILQRYAVSTMLAKTSHFVIPDQGEVEYTETHLFELFPSPLGSATNTNLLTGEKLTLEMFNRVYMN